jgi:hypothetical protein
MPARHSQHPILKTAALALALGAAACDGADSPVAPDGAEPRAPQSTTPAPDFLTAGTGPRILFSSARTGGTDIYRMDPRIAFVSLRSGKSQIWTVSSAGGTQVRITHTSVAEGAPAWSH